MNIIYQKNFPFPPQFKLYGGVDPQPLYLGNNAWLVAVTGSIHTGSIQGDKSTFGAYIFYWDGVNTAQMIGSRIANSRSVNAIKEQHVWNWAIQGDNGNDTLLLSIVDGLETHNNPAQVIQIDLPPARWIGDDNYSLTEALIKTKLRLTDTLVNAIRDALIKNGLAK